jgi:hypothetical protein
MVYIRPRFITWLITSCLDPLHAPKSIACSRIHYIDYMLPNPLHVASVHRCQSIGSGPGHRQRRRNRCVARLARLMRAVNSPASVGFNLQDIVPACSDRNLQHTDEVAASTRSLHR